MHQPTSRSRPRRFRKTVRAAVAVLALTLGMPALSASAAPAPNAAPTGDATSYISTVNGPGRFPLVADRAAAPLLVSTGDYAGVLRVVNDLGSDIEKVTGVRPAVLRDAAPRGADPVIIGTIGRSPLIDRMITSRRIDVHGIAGKWETSLQQVVNFPLPGIRRALVIAGSDQRGTIYGAYDVSKRIGVSPYYFWDDTVPQHQNALYVLPGRHSQGTPAVKYRGFFINDENPSTGRWAPATFGPGKADGFPGGLNHAYYAKIFETMLRLKANYLWPAVWGRAFAEDDPVNHATATEYGVVMGTSHEAPMMRGIEEWNRHAVPAVRDSAGNIVTPGHDPYGGTGEWSFRRNADAVQAYWADGIRRMVNQSFEGVVTLGMRGNGDVGLPDGDGIDLMQNIIATERRLLGDVTGKDVTTIPQVWTLYKEVQRYWDKGLRAPDDVTVVFTDDNWGNIRKVPDQSLPPRSGGYGLYYHFDYVGGGRDYKWVDTANLANTWEQLHLAHTTGINQLWVANVGDMKNDEQPLQFFLDYAWNPDAMPASAIPAWERQYAAENFGSAQSAAIAGVLHDYSLLQSARKPELLNRAITLDPAKNPATDGSAVLYNDQATPFSTANYGELDAVTARWQALAARAERVGRTLRAADQDAYYQLVLYQVQATANLYALRDAEFTNILYAAQGRASTNDLATVTEARFADDQALSTKYNTRIAGGKWKDWQTQPHIDYGDVARYGPNAAWQQPELNNDAIPDVIFPAVKRITLPTAAELGVAIDGSDQWWPAASTPAVLPAFSPYQTEAAQYVDVFNRGATGFDYRISSPVPWLHVTPNRGRVDKQVRATVTVDWAHAPHGTTTVPITITGAGGTVRVNAPIQNPTLRPSGFVEANGVVSIAAADATRITDGNGGFANWTQIAGIGRDGDDGMTVLPATTPRQVPGGTGPRLDYTMTLTTTGPVNVWAYLSPRNNVLPTTGLSYAVSIDGETPQVVNATAATGADDTSMNRQWERNTSDNVNLTRTTHVISTPGVHTLRFWMVDPTVVVQKLVVDTGGLRPSYFGPPESMRFPIR
jgi:hypothetical protein